MELILNDISASPVAENITDSRLRMEYFLQLCRQAYTKGINRILRTKESFRYSELSRDYTILQWMNDIQVDKEMRLFFKSMVTKSPYIDEIIDAEIYQRLLLSDFLFNGLPAEGLGATYLLDALAISFYNNLSWDSSLLLTEMRYLNEEEECVVEQVAVRHIAQLEHLNEHNDWLNSVTMMNPPKNGHDLWTRKDELFPRLVFCENIYESIKNLNYSHAVFRQICLKLKVIDEHFTEWSDSKIKFENFPFKLSPESQVTLNNYKSKHMFKLPSGEEKVFSWHFRLTPMEWRVFFDVDKVSKKIVLGHIGEKLPTVKYPT